MDSLINFLYSKSRVGTHNFKYFSDQGIPGPKPIPFIGNVWAIWRKVYN